MGTHWARLSEREKALLHNGQTYGRSCVWVRTCLSARSASMQNNKNSGDSSDLVSQK
jgi:hypothetical protein